MGRKKQSRPGAASKRSSLAAQKRSILRSPDWINKGLVFCTSHGPWPAWEQRLLKELSLGPSYDFDSAVKYSRDVLKRPWPDLEGLLVGCMRGPDVIRIKFAELSCFIHYARYHDGSPTLEREILAQGFPAAAFVYAAYCTRRRWPAAEPLILTGDTAARPALSTGLGDILDISQWASSLESQAVTYARLFLTGGWPALEAKMAQYGCHPQVAFEYAEKVLRGPLSQPIENWLLLESFDTAGNEYRKKYLAFAAACKAQNPPASLFSTP